GQNQPRRDDFGLKIGKLSHRTSIKDGLGRHIGSCGPLNRNFLSSTHLTSFLEITIMTIEKHERSTKDLVKAAVSGWLGTALEFMDFKSH
ncbi:hypothetical protein NGG84_23205, partial [Escherichia coli]|nr:hypothetical protein [Escherichia coli]